MLLRWREEGSLARELAMLDVEVLATWLKRLVGVEVAPAAASSVVQDATVAEIAARVDAIKMLVPRGAARDRARELLFVVEYFAIHGVDAVAARVALRAFRRANVAAGMADDLVDTNPEIAVHKQRDVVSVARTAAEIGATRNVAASSSQTRPRESFEIEVPCALPFLLLGPLGRTGYFERLAAMLDAARASAHAHGFAHALARKVLAPPARGWLRTAGDIAAAAALAARADCDEESIANVGQALRSQLAVLDGCIADRLIADHRETAGWFIALASHGDAVLFDEDGLVPVAFGEPEALALRIAPSCNTKGQERCEEALNGLSALRDERPALRPHVNDAFENTVTLAASYALGVIAWTLWSTRERPTPAMALHTFADLDARVHVTRGEIHVALPLGRRFWDLRDHGLLADVRGLPWLPETRVTFGTG